MHAHERIECIILFEITSRVIFGCLYKGLKFVITGNVHRGYRSEHLGCGVVGTASGCAVAVLPAE